MALDVSHRLRTATFRFEKGPNTGTVNPFGMIGIWLPNAATPETWGSNYSWAPQSERPYTLAKLQSFFSQALANDLCSKLGPAARATAEFVHSEDATHVTVQLKLTSTYYPGIDYPLDPNNIDITQYWQTWLPWDHESTPAQSQADFWDRVDWCENGGDTPRHDSRGPQPVKGVVELKLANTVQGSSAPDLLTEITVYRSVDGGSGRYDWRNVLVPPSAVFYREEQLPPRVRRAYLWGSSSLAPHGPLQLTRYNTHFSKSVNVYEGMSGTTQLTLGKIKGSLDSALQAALATRPEGESRALHSTLTVASVGSGFTVYRYEFIIDVYTHWDVFFWTQPRPLDNYLTSVVVGKKDGVIVHRPFNAAVDKQVSPVASGGPKFSYPLSRYASVGDFKNVANQPSLASILASTSDVSIPDVPNPPGPVVPKPYEPTEAEKMIQIIIALIMALVSYFGSKKAGATSTQAGLIAAGAGLGSYYVATETEWGKSTVSAIDGTWQKIVGPDGQPVKNQDGSDATLPTGSEPKKNADGSYVFDSLGKLVGTTVTTAGSVLESWGPTGTATVIGTAAVAGDSKLRSMLPLILGGLGLFLLLK